MFKDLDPLLHSQLRLAVMSILISAESAEFTYLKEKDQQHGGQSQHTTGQACGSLLYNYR